MATATEAPASVTAEGPTSHTQNQADTRPANTFGYTRAEQIEALHKLREPFLPTEIRYLPRVWCKACKNAGWKGCEQHPVDKCGKCKQKMPRNGHIDLAYVGHAEATNRLLNVDPFWDWEPLTVDERGLPQFDGYRGLWIRLTVCGMSRLGYGHAGDKTGGDALKEVIGDAIRNAGMRFGMALDLWTSSDLEIVESGGASLDETASSPAQDSRPEAARPRSMSPAETQQLVLGPFLERVRNGWDSLEATLQALAEAKAKALLNELVPFGEPKVPTRVEDMLNVRIKKLRARQAELNGHADTHARSAA
ncbi:hypothetical protein [Streptomyces sp. DH8]|uniref:hypothetical protein n=1 Tax=Streptomyces sp. DH8 TaxID=2857008 RepID=UPI001E284800|nr:hypothetical protein [Streptomyces sp. DH8]